MQEEKERQQKTEKSSQWVETELGDASKGETSTSTLKVKTSKGRKIEVARMETGRQTGKTSQRQAEKAKDKSKDKKDESLMQEELEEKYDDMTPEEEREMTSQLTPRERAEYWEMTKFYQVQASVTGQGMELRSEMIKERAK